MDGSTRTPAATSLRQRLLLLGIVALFILIFLRYQSGQWRQIPAGIDEKDFDRARKQFVEQTRLQPNQSDVLNLLGEMALREDKLELAATSYQAIPIEDQQYGLSAKLRAGEILMRLNRAADSEASFRIFLQHASGQLPADHPDVALARSWISYLMAVELRFEDRHHILAEQHRAGSLSIEDAKQLYFPSLLIWNSTRGREKLKAFLEREPENLALNVAHGRYLTGAGNLDAAERHLEFWLTRCGDDLTCVAALLECYFEKNDWIKFDDLMINAPELSRDEPWLLTQMRGQHALHHQQWEQAVLCLEHYLEQDPASTTACMGLSRAFTQIGRSEQAQTVQKRMLILAKIRPRLSDVTESNPEALEELADNCEEIDLADAAITFRQLARVSRQTSR